MAMLRNRMFASAQLAVTLENDGSRSLGQPKISVGLPGNPCLEDDSEPFGLPLARGVTLLLETLRALIEGYESGSPVDTKATRGPRPGLPRPAARRGLRRSGPLVGGRGRQPRSPAGAWLGRSWEVRHPGIVKHRP